MPHMRDVREKKRFINKIDAIQVANIDKAMVVINEYNGCYSFFYSLFQTTVATV